MRSVNVAELKNQLSRYLKYARGGEEIIIRDRSLPIAKLVPLADEDTDEQDLALVAAGKMRLPKTNLDINKIAKIPTGRVSSADAIRTLLKDREESL